MLRKSAHAVIGLSLLFAVSTGLCGTITYDSSGGGGDSMIYQPTIAGGGLCPQDALFQVYNNADNSVLHSPGTWSGDGWVEGSFNTSLNPVTVYGTVTLTSGPYAGSWVKLNTQPISFAAIPMPMQYVTGGASENQWTIVPEPGTLALFGLGAVVVALARRRMK